MDKITRHNQLVQKLNQMQKLLRNADSATSYKALKADMEKKEEELFALKAQINNENIMIRNKVIQFAAEMRS